MHTDPCRFWGSSAPGTSAAPGQSKQESPLGPGGRVAWPGLPADGVGQGVRATFRFAFRRNNAVQPPVRRGPAERGQDVSRRRWPGVGSPPWSEVSGSLGGGATSALAPSGASRPCSPSGGPRPSGRWCAAEVAPGGEHTAACHVENAEGAAPDVGDGPVVCGAVANAGPSPRWAAVGRGAAGRPPWARATSPQVHPGRPSLGLGVGRSSWEETWTRADPETPPSSALPSSAPCQRGPGIHAVWVTQGIPGVVPALS